MGQAKMNINQTALRAHSAEKAESQRGKIFKVLAIALATAALLILLGSFWQKEASGAFHVRQENYGYQNEIIESIKTQPDNYVFPSSAIETGRIALRVDDLAATEKSVRSVAIDQEGEVVFYEINNATSNLENGMMVIKVAADKFQDAFAELKKSGMVVQESVIKGQNLPAVCPMNAVQNSAEDQVLETEKKDTAVEQVEEKNAAAESVIAQVPCIDSQNGSFSYIKVVFVAKNGVQKFWENNVNTQEAVSILTTAGKIILVVVAIKILVTLLMMVFLFYLIMKFLRHTVLKPRGVQNEKTKENKKTQTKPLRKSQKVAVKRKTPSKTGLKK